LNKAKLSLHNGDDSLIIENEINMSTPFFTKKTLGIDRVEDFLFKNYNQPNNLSLSSTSNININSANFNQLNQGFDGKTNKTNVSPKSKNVTSDNHTLSLSEFSNYSYSSNNYSNKNCISGSGYSGYMTPNNSNFNNLNLNKHSYNFNNNCTFNGNNNENARNSHSNFMMNAGMNCFQAHNSFCMDQNYGNLTNININSNNYHNPKIVYNELVNSISIFYCFRDSKSRKAK
jgi:hypothetical protein